MNNERYICPHCGTRTIDFPSEKDLKNGILYTKTICLNCKKPFYFVYKFVGCLTTNEFNEIMPKYRVSVTIEKISVSEYAIQYNGNAETLKIMSEYEDFLTSKGLFNAVFSKLFSNLEDAKKEFARQESYHSSENGDAMNIRDTIDRVSRNTEYKQTIFYCEDGHDITITLEEIH